MQWADLRTMERIASHELMGRAGRAVAEAVLACRPDAGRVVIVTGPGNNGGDGLAAACWLRRRNLPVTVVMLVDGEALRGDARWWFERAREQGVKLRSCADSVAELDRWLARAMLVVDCMFGTGLTRALEGRFAEAVARINAVDRVVLSVDLPSGIDSDRGDVLGAAVRADFTLPIAAHKWGHWLGAGPEHAGCMLPVAEIGIDEDTIRAAFAACDEGMKGAYLIERATLAQVWPPRPRDAHKGMFGHVWVFGGSVGLTGAPRLAGLGALAAGAGLASLVCPDPVWPVVAGGALELMVHPESSQAWQQPAARIDALVAGPGWGKQQGALLETLLTRPEPLVLDADALNMLAVTPALQQSLRARSGVSVLTPHPGEAARLLDVDTGAIQRDRRQAAMALAERFDAWVVLKGRGTLIASPAGELWLCPYGAPQLAVAGSGDVLAGVIAACIARDGQTLARRLGAAVALHALAGEQEGWWLAGGLADRIARLRQRLECSPAHGQAGRGLLG